MTSSSFRTVDSAPRVLISYNDAPLEVPADVSVAAALLSAGVTHTRVTPVSGTPRAPYCMMGVCFECLVEIDGRPNRQACLTMVQPGMQVRTQQRARAIHVAEARHEA